MQDTIEAPRTGAAEFKDTFQLIRAEVRKMIVAQEGVIDGVLTALMAGGHVLLEGVPGLMLAAKVQALLDGRFAVSTDDIASVARSVLRHRVVTNFHAQATKTTSDDLLHEVLASVTAY